MTGSLGGRGDGALASHLTSSSAYSAYSAVDVTGPAAQQAARAELSKPEYHRDDPGLTSRILTWIGHLIDFLLSGSVTGSAFLVVAVLLLAAVAAALWRAAVASSSPERRGRPANPLQPVAEVDHRRLAEQYTTEGRHAEALREWLRAAVQTAEQRGVIEPRPGRTGDEFAREAALLLPAAAGQLTTAATAFDLVWFGGEPADPSGVQAARQAADAVRSARIERPVRW